MSCAAWGGPAALHELIDVSCAARADASSCAVGGCQIALCGGARHCAAQHLCPPSLVCSTAGWLRSARARPLGSPPTTAKCPAPPSLHLCESGRLLGPCRLCASCWADACALRMAAAAPAACCLLPAARCQLALLAAARQQRDTAVPHTWHLCLLGDSRCTRCKPCLVCGCSNLTTFPLAMPSPAGATRRWCVSRIPWRVPPSRTMGRRSAPLREWRLCWGRRQGLPVSCCWLLLAAACLPPPAASACCSAAALLMLAGALHP